MIRKYIQNILFLHFCLMMIFLGGVLFETFVSYPNWFHNIPASLEITNSFMQVRNPGDFFQKVVPLSVLTGLVFIISGWGINAARNFIIGSVIMMIGIEVLTVAYIYPRIGIMISEGSAIHSAEVLMQTANEFLSANQIRVGLILIAEAFSFIGLWKFAKHKFSTDPE